MWILENDGDALNGTHVLLPTIERSSDHVAGKKLWLRPGKKFLFGRTKYEGVRWNIFEL